MTALVSLRAGLRGARPAADDHRAAGRPRRCPTGPSACACATCASPTPAPTRCRWPRWRRSRVLDHRGGDEVLHGVDLEVAPGRLLALVGPSGAGKSTIASLRPAALRRRRAARSSWAGIDVRDLTFADRARRGRRRHPGRAPVPRHDRGQPALRRPGRHRRRADRRAAPRPARRAARRAARRPGHGGGRARLPALRRRAPAPHDRAPAAGPAAGGHPRRGHRAPGLRVGGRGAGGAGRGARRAHGDRHRPPALDDPGGRRRSPSSSTARIVERGTHDEPARARAAATPRSTARSSPTTSGSSAARPPRRSRPSGC